MQWAIFPSGPTVSLYLSTASSLDSRAINATLLGDTSIAANISFIDGKVEAAFALKPGPLAITTYGLKNTRKNDAKTAVSCT